MPTSRKAFRWRRTLALAWLALVLAAAGTLVVLVAGSRLRLDGERRLAGLHDAVSISRDVLGTATMIRPATCRCRSR